MMVRFSCFHAHIHSHKQKKTVQNSDEAMVTALEICSKECSLKDFANSSGMSPLLLKVQIDSNNADDHVLGSSSIEQDWKSEGNKSKHSFDSDPGIHKIESLKKILSLGSALDKKAKVLGCSDSEGEIDKEYSCDLSNDHCPYVIPVGSKDPGSRLPDLSQETLRSDSVQLNYDVANNGSIFSVGVQERSESECCEDLDTKLLNHVAYTSAFIVKSKSLPNLLSFIFSTNANVARSRSYEDLNVLNSRKQEILVNEVQRLEVDNHERDNNVFINEEHGFENLDNENYNTYEYVESAGDWIIPVIDEVKSVKTLHIEHSLCRRDELPTEDFKIKRIEEWVMDLQNCSPSEVIDELFTYDEHQVQNDDTIVGLSAAKLDVKISPGMEAAKKYISSLSASATAAQLANYGLDMIPFFSSFVSLRALNLSGNSLARITLGALPRGLHALNLSRNNISIIEGFRELTCLRVLDLSYNRIFRIGHGLASCSSLKELYLAGNKISEVDGLHRLLKLIVLDLQFNKISTSKSLGQLAANYNSLQAIRLEGNPAQKNVGDEQLKKYLLCLLPRLSYYNMQSIKAGTLKDVAYRSARLSLSSHQIDRGLRSGLKSMRKGNHSRKTQATASRYTSRSRHVYPPPAATKPTAHQNNVSNKLLSFKANLSMHRSRSEGTLGAL